MNDLRKLFAIADQETKAGHHKAAIQAYQQILKQSELGSQAQHLAHWGTGERAWIETVFASALDIPDLLSHHHSHEDGKLLAQSCRYLSKNGACRDVIPMPPKYQLSRVDPNPRAEAPQCSPRATATAGPAAPLSPPVESFDAYHPSSIHLLCVTVLPEIRLVKVVS